MLIDFPDFNLRLAANCTSAEFPSSTTSVPQLWAWRQSRVELIRRYVRKMLVIFPFEQKFYANHGIHAEFVGHPLADAAANSITREAFAAQYGLDSAKPWIALLPGSRKGEVSRIFPTLLAAAQLLGRDYVYIVPVASTLREPWMRALCRPIPGLSCLYQRRCADSGSCARGSGGQRNIDLAGGADWNALCHGLSGCGIVVEVRTSISESRSICHA